MLFDDVEVLDFAGPYEVLVAARRADNDPYFEVVTVAEKRDVTCWGGLRVTADHTFSSCPKLDFLIVPGGPGAREKLPEVQAAPIAFILERREELRRWHRSAPAPSSSAAPASSTACALRPTRAASSSFAPSSLR